MIGGLDACIGARFLIKGLGGIKGINGYLELDGYGYARAVFELRLVVCLGGFLGAKSRGGRARKGGQST